MICARSADIRALCHANNAASVGAAMQFISRFPGFWTSASLRKTSVTKPFFCFMALVSHALLAFAVRAGGAFCPRRQV